MSVSPQSTTVNLFYVWKQDNLLKNVDEEEMVS